MRKHGVYLISAKHLINLVSDIVISGILAKRNLKAQLLHR